MAWYKEKDGKFDVRHEMVQIIADEIKKANVGIDIRSTQQNHFINQKSSGNQ